MNVTEVWQSSHARILLIRRCSQPHTVSRTRARVGVPIRTGAIGVPSRYRELREAVFPMTNPSPDDRARNSHPFVRSCIPPNDYQADADIDLPVPRKLQRRWKPECIMRSLSVWWVRWKIDGFGDHVHRFEPNGWFASFLIRVNIASAGYWARRDVSLRGEEHESGENRKKALHLVCMSDETWQIRVDAIRQGFAKDVGMI